LRKMKTLILTCSREDRYCGGYMRGVMAASLSPEFGGWMTMAHESDIARGRSKLMSRALDKTAFNSFLWVDDDIHFTREDFENMACAPVDVVGGLYVKRHEGLSPVYNGPEGEPHPLIPEIVAVKEIGTGFLRVTRRALEAVAGSTISIDAGWKHWFYAGPAIQLGKDAMDAGYDYLSEDYAFCRSMWNAYPSPIPVHLHKAVRLGHEGTAVYRPEEAA
jgi:hypothetical protein